MPSPPPPIRPTSSRTRRRATRSRLAIAKAICKGTLCLYIRPNEEGVSYYRDTWSYGQLVYQKHAIEEIAAFRAQLKGWMVRGEVEGQPKMSVARSRSDPP